MTDTTTTTPPLDPITTGIVERRLRMIAREMGTVLLRTTRSPVFHQAQDFATAIFDPEGGLLQQGDHIPLLAVALGPGLRAVIDRAAGEVSDGDVFVHNDVFSGGNQLSDIGAYMPVVVDGELIGWVGCKGHQADIGGAVRGGVNPAAREVWEEGLRIPAVKLVEQGRLLLDVWELLLANVRIPEVVGHDLRAQLGSCVVGARGVRELVVRHGADGYRRHTMALVDATEGMTRRFVRSIPDGVHSAVVHKRLPGEAGSVAIALTVTIEGDRLHVDATGSGAQTPTYVNAPAATSMAAIVLVFRMLGAGDIALNEGMLRVLDVTIPRGSVLDAAYPGATAYGNHLTDQIAMALFTALAPALPDRVPAAWNPLYGSYISGEDRDGRPFHDVLFLANKGGSGAVQGADGADHIGSIEACGTIRSADYELFELHNDVTILHHEYERDSAGVGEWRGGLGVLTRLRFEGPWTDLVLYGDGLDEGAFGLQGGGAGARNHAEVIHPDGRRQVTAANEVVTAIAAGAVLEKRAGGGGGLGDPRRRDRAAVARDLRAGLISAPAAEGEYGLDVAGQVAS